MPNEIKPSEKRWAHLEITSGIIRVFDTGTHWGHPFDYALALSGDEGVATIKGLSRASPSVDDFHKIGCLLRRSGFEKMRWTRHRVSDGQIHITEFDTRRFAEAV
jgi:hypothetical protein